MSTAIDAVDIPTGPGSVAGAPGLPANFGETFTSSFVDIGGLRLHTVIGGSGPAVLLLCGWPQTWYAWRLLMPALARDFTVVVPDPRGVGLSDMPEGGYDTGTLAQDMVELMEALGHKRFAVVGHDVGMWTGYAMAADHPERVERLALAEALIPGLTDSPPLFAGHDVVNRLWHFTFNRLPELNEMLVAGREQLFFGWQFAAKAATPLPSYAVDRYIEALASSPQALHASFGPYRALDTTIEQNRRRRERRLPMPVLTIAGERSTGALIETTIGPVAEAVHAHLSLVDCGHFPAEEAPEETLAALTDFLAPYLESATQG
ncbi:alpha/beta fold hydrolase [Mycolicibacterium sp.]|uniref:alpha/beta fold hydrolase n=1 Tax=Mycolicibacterium sp. TaxID=2320850 RepID=UPI003D0FE5A3